MIMCVGVCQTINSAELREHYWQESVYIYQSMYIHVHVHCIYMYMYVLYINIK